MQRSKKGVGLVIRFTFRFMLMVLLLFFGILTGMNIAERGIIDVAGTPETEVESLLISQNNDRLEVVFLGKTYVSDLKPEQLPFQGESPEPTKVPVKEQKTNISLLSKVGNNLGNIFQAGAEKGLNLLASFIEKD